MSCEWRSPEADVSCTPSIWTSALPLLLCEAVFGMASQDLLLPTFAF